MSITSKIRSYEEAHRVIVGRRCEPGPERDMRERAAREAAQRSEVFKEQGFVERPWRPTSPGSPCVVTVKTRYGSYKEWDHSYTPDGPSMGWLDHPYRLVNKEEGITIFVAEPYGITMKDMKELTRLESEGWEVEIDAGRSLWFPGLTTAIWIRKRSE